MPEVPIWWLILHYSCMSFHSQDPKNLILCYHCCKTYRLIFVQQALCLELLYGAAVNFSIKKMLSGLLTTPFFIFQINSLTLYNNVSSSNLDYKFPWNTVKPTWLPFIMCLKNEIVIKWAKRSENRITEKEKEGTTRSCIKSK